MFAGKLLENAEKLLSKKKYILRVIQQEVIEIAAEKSQEILKEVGLMITL